MRQQAAEVERLIRGWLANDAERLRAWLSEQRDEAAAALVAERSPAADAAARAIAAGDFAAAVATLERDARAATEDAAERWRRLGALARAQDTAKARQAYEEAFKLEPGDFLDLCRACALASGGG